MSPMASLVTIDQFNVANDGSFETTMSTSGNLWKYDGTYTIQVDYGSLDNNVKVELTGGVLSKTIQEIQEERFDIARELEKERERELGVYEREQAQQRIEDWANSNHDANLVMDGGSTDTNDETNMWCNGGSISGEPCVEPGPPIVMILGVAVIVIIAVIVSKRKKVTITETNTTTRRENITDIDKQIAINEEKLRKIEEESKRLDEED